MALIKMCGLFREEDISFANTLLPDYIGFVFYKKSCRYVDKEKARSLKSLLNKKIKAVGVFVDEDISFIAELANEGIIDLIQLHGHEDENYIRRLKYELKDNPIKIIKAVVVKDIKDIDQITDDPFTDFYLLDSGMGSGNTFDWQLLNEVKKPFFLAGGLNNENIKEALKSVNPYAVDVSSGIETDGIKDFNKMNIFADIVRNS